MKAITAPHFYGLKCGAHARTEIKTDEVEYMGQS